MSSSLRVFFSCFVAGFVILILIGRFVLVASPYSTPSVTWLSGKEFTMVILRLPFDPPPPPIDDNNFLPICFYIGIIELTFFNGNDVIFFRSIVGTREVSAFDSTTSLSSSSPLRSLLSPLCLVADFFDYLDLSEDAPFDSWVADFLEAWLAADLCESC